MTDETLDKSRVLEARVTTVPGLLLVFAGSHPCLEPLPLLAGGDDVEMGRDHRIFARHLDGRVSRSHARIRLGSSGRVSVTDLGSRNGTRIDGVDLKPSVPRDVDGVLRIGDSLFLPVPDVEPFARLGVRVEGERVLGPRLQEALEVVGRSAKLGRIVHVTGSSGAGKEGLAQAFHTASGATGRFVPVNCATIPEGVAERLLFGAKRGAYSGADADAEGYVQAAHGGTLFLDEVAELGLAVQAKLLRVLETGEVLPLGAATPRKVDLRLCTATHKDLRAEVAGGRLREDLFFRIASPSVAAPPLRERREEIPWLVAGEVERTATDLAIHVSLVEECLLRPWPGNVRELRAVVRTCAQAALAAGGRLDASRLPSDAGHAFATAAAPEQPASADKRARPRPPVPAPGEIERALAQANGSQREAARILGVHRTQLRRWIDRHGLKVPTTD